MQPVLALLPTLLLLPLVYPGQPQNQRMVRTMPSSLDEGETCYCVVHLPKSILLQQLEQLQGTTQELVSKFKQVLSMVGAFVPAIEGHNNQVLNMSHMLKFRNSSVLTLSSEPSTLDQLHLELERVQKLLTQLNANGGVNGARYLLHQLQIQVTNISLMLKLLADADQSSFRALQQQVDILEAQLHECKREREQEETYRHHGSFLPPDSCSCGSLQKVSRPFVVKLNWRGFSYKAGSWGRDSAPNQTSSLYWVAPLSADGRYFDYYRLYKTYDDLVLLKNYEERKMGYGDGSGNAVYNNFMYFNYYGSNDMAKVDLASNTIVLQRPLPGATYNDRFSYAGVPWKTLDFAVDEKGLWVLYATEGSRGNLVVSRLNTSTLEVEKTWHTRQYKPALSGAFMACGVLYTLRSLSIRQEEIFYAFDTATGQEQHLSIILDKMLETLQGINYCPLDQKLYVFNDGYLVNYDLTFLKCKLPRSPTKRASRANAPQKPVNPPKPSMP
ncbi:olfactomedin-4-like [Ochotona curzoniae]|uniref:olfactomedin-4-like n=1 Tax=Ochotona curzoniae TaxID=130825 RepID=UPI001B354239|nr:olfactomedin-4-like [Ochotona curzoniae]